MGSRYALREVEASIGYDCRRLDGGRRASFRHTFLHKRSRRDLLERRDLLRVLGSSYVAMAALSADPRMDLDASLEAIGDVRESLLKSAFPYMKAKAKPKKYEDYSEYFDELDELERMEKKEALDANAPNDIMNTAK